MLTEGVIVKSYYWEEPVLIKKVEQVPDGYRIVGETVNSHRHVDDIIPNDILPELEVMSARRTYTADPELVFLALEALRYRYISSFDPFLALNVSKIDPLPFQIEAVYGYVLRLPRIRFMIADDPGAGKTIMAGLIVKELKLRGVVERVLIVVPGQLKDQWRRELKEKFQESFTVVDRSTFDNTYGESPWEKYSQVITSMDFAKQDEILQTLTSVNWDLVIVDEAHKMAAYEYGNKQSKTARYKLGEVLSRTSTHLLFLTATPHKGDPENFRLFLDLLEPGFFAEPNALEDSIRNRDNPLFIRRLKEDLRDFEGRPIFTNRYARTVKYRLSDPEKRLYNKVSEYVVRQYSAIGNANSKRSITFALLILQRRMASSTYSLLKSLERRKKRLEELLRSGGLEQKKTLLLQPQELEDLEESERWKIEEDWEAVSTAKNTEELKNEIQTLEELISLAEEVIRSGTEVKLNELRKAIDEALQRITEMGGNRKILIFTESKDTLDYLVSNLRSWGFRVNYIHGGMSLEERIAAEREFKNETEIMVATEAAGEGINLQFCHVMINYDIPWNPNRLEQRMGRIHRYGQQKDTYMFNLVAEDTKEGIVLSRLFDKLDEIRTALGSDRVFDVIGDIFAGRDLQDLLVEAILNAKSMDEIVREIDAMVDEESIKRVKEALGESLATKNIDYTRIRELAEKAREFRIASSYIEQFTQRALKQLGRELRLRKDGFYELNSVPFELQSIASDPQFKLKYGSLNKSFQEMTFDKEVAFKNPDAEFVSFGHPLLEAIIEWLRVNCFEALQQGATFADPEGRLDGYLWFYEGEVRDGTGTTAAKKLFAVFTSGTERAVVNPAIIWDLPPCANCAVEGCEDELAPPEDEVLRALRQYKEETLEERQRQAEVKRKYGLRSLDYLIGMLDAEITALFERQLNGEKVDLPLNDKRLRKERYEDARRRLEELINRETKLVVGSPRLVSVLRVVPLKTELVPDPEIERVGMEVAMEYERTKGRQPEDVSSQNLGYDIRSKGNGEVRYIEVKARAKTGEIVLTPNEWFKAQDLRESYWLYIVENAAENPVLRIINDPANKLAAEPVINIVRFKVPVEEWKGKGVVAQ
ncbi:DUF3883 domain-containing protein [Coprothermobacteraceae bacterium]|nr:DUF3883 domain-containing protein [Coprothermobacteraceae bacterium]